MKRINKTTAEKLFNEGKDIWITPRFMKVERGLLINNNKFNHDYNSFEELVRAFTWYNCNTQVGRYPAFYIEE